MKIYLVLDRQIVLKAFRYHTDARKFIENFEDANAFLHIIVRDLID